MSSNRSILLTGATGSLGAAVLKQLLKTGHHVNAVLRSFAKSRDFLEKKYSKQCEAGALTFTEIPDMAIPGVFDGPASNATAIIHVATPLACSDWEEKLIKPTWQIDENILTAAQKSTTVKRIIITGSIVAMLPLPEGLMNDKTYNENDFNPISHEQAAQGGTPGAYSYAKVSSEQKAWEFMAREKPAFDLVMLLAPSITGRCIQEGFVPDKNALGGMGGIYRDLFDVKVPGFLFPFSMDVDDIATIHLKALDSSTTPGNQRYVFHIPELMTANKVVRKIREEYPQLRSRVPEPKGEGDGLPQPLCKFDTSKADKVFGTQWKSGWESVKATVDDILKYETRDAAKA